MSCCSISRVTVRVGSSLGWWGEWAIWGVLLLPGRAPPFIPALLPVTALPLLLPLTTQWVLQTHTKHFQQPWCAGGQSWSVSSKIKCCLNTSQLWAGFVPQFFTKSPLANLHFATLPHLPACPTLIYRAVVSWLIKVVCTLQEGIFGNRPAANAGPLTASSREPGNGPSLPERQQICVVAAPAFVSRSDWSSPRNFMHQNTQHLYKIWRKKVG